MVFGNGWARDSGSRVVHRALAASVGVLLALAGGTVPHLEPAQGQSPVRPTGPEKCAKLDGHKVAGVTITGVKHFNAKVDGAEVGFCQVSGHRAPLLDIEIDLPDRWSGRLYQQGGGGFNGSITSAIRFDGTGEIAAVHPALTTHGAIYAASNGGNRAGVPGEAAPGVWAADTDLARASLRDYAFGSLWTTMRFAKGLSREYYGSEPRRSYFNGCSNGGREAHIVAQRWPSEFDGIVTGCEGGDTGRQVAAWLSLGSKSGTPAALSAEQYRWAYASAVDACDSDDGIEDEYLANPAGCAFDPARLGCDSAGGERHCLTRPQVRTLRSLLTPLRDSDREVVYDAFNWTDFSQFAPLFGSLGGGFGMIATGDPSWLKPKMQATYDIDEDFHEIGYGLLEIGADHNRDELAAYVANGGKLLSWHAAGDNLLSAREHGRTFRDLTNRLGKLGLRSPSDGARYLQVPSNQHGGGSSLSEVDWMTAIIEWVEDDTPPLSLVYSFEGPNGTKRSLPVCEYPEHPWYVGGDANDSANYECRGH